MLIAIGDYWPAENFGRFGHISLTLKCPFGR